MNDVCVSPVVLQKLAISNPREEIEESLLHMHAAIFIHAYGHWDTDMLEMSVVGIPLVFQSFRWSVLRIGTRCYKHYYLYNKNVLSVEVPHNFKASCCL